MVGQNKENDDVLQRFEWFAHNELNMITVVLCPLICFHHSVLKSQHYLNNATTSQPKETIVA